MIIKDDKNPKFYVYSSLHRYHSLRDEAHRHIGIANKALIKFAFRTKLFKKLNARGHYLFNNIDVSPYNNSRLVWKDPIPEIINYTKIKTDSVHFFEVLEIDEFEKFEKRILKFVKSNRNRKGSLIALSSIQTTKKDLASIKTSFDVISYGEFFTINLEKNGSSNFSLIKFLRFSYIKTSESYFIINLEITPSKLFHDYFEKIVQSDAGFAHYPHFNNIFSVLKGSQPEKYYSIKALKGENLNKLFKDLNYQAQFFLKQKFRGVFLAATKKHYLPSLQNFIVTNLEEFHNDDGLLEYFNRNIAEVFVDKKKKTEIVFPRFQMEEDKHHVLKTIKEKPEDAEEDLDGMESYIYDELLRAITTPWTLINILDLYWNNIALLKRKIYDFIKKNSNQNFIRKFLRFFTTQKIIQLKYDLAKYRVIFTRFEKEFISNSLWIYTHHFDLSVFTKQNSDKTETNLLKYMQELVKAQLRRSDGEIKVINENFTRIEEINSFRTNLFLQYASILLSMLALIFTFDKVKSTFISLWQLIKSYL